MDCWGSQDVKLNPLFKKAFKRRSPKNLFFFKIANIITRHNKM